MAARPTSPTSLLWAHQLKREHGHLLERMKQLEKSHEAYDARIKVAEGVAENLKGKLQDIREMSRHIAAIEDDDKDVKEWIEKLDGERQARMEKESEKVNKLQHKISALEEQWRKAQQDAQQLSSTHRSALEKIDELEATMQKQTRSTEKLSKKNDPGDVKVLMRRLDAMESRRTDEVRRHEELMDKITELETVNRRLNTETDGLRLEVARLKDRVNIPHLDIVLSSEATTDRNFRTTNIDGNSQIQVPQSPLLSSLDQGTAVQDYSLDDSPTLDAQMRKSARVAPQESQQAQRVVASPSLKLTPVPMTKADTVSSQQKQSGTANSGKKRQAPPQAARQTRSQAKLAVGQKQVEEVTEDTQYTESLDYERALQAAKRKHGLRLQRMQDAQKARELQKAQEAGKAQQNEKPASVATGTGQAPRVPLKETHNQKPTATAPLRRLQKEAQELKAMALAPARGSRKRKRPELIREGLV